MLFQHVVARPDKLVGGRLQGHHRMALGLLSLVVGVDPRLETYGKVGRLDERPGQILVAVLSIAAAFDFTVGQLLGLTQRA